MITKKILKKIFLLGLSILTFLLSNFFVNPSHGITNKYQTLIEQGFINGVKTPQEIGLDYLSQPPIEIAYDRELMNAIYEAREETSVLPENISVKFNLGTNYPIAINDDEYVDEHQYYDDEAIGYINLSGYAKTFDAPTLESMFSVEARNRGNLVVNSEAQEILITDARKNLLLAQRIPKMDLIVHSKRNNEVFILENVNANAVCRDALNGVLTGNLSRNYYTNF